MELPELPPAQRRCIEFNGQAFLTEPVPGCVTIEEATAYGLSCARAALERAAQIAEGENDYGVASDQIARAIRAEMSKEEGK